MNTLSLAWRNLLRNRRRSLTTLLAMMIGAVAILLFGGYSGNINLGLQTDFVRRGGHLQIQRQDYFLYGTGNPAAYGIRDYQRVIDVVKHDPVLAPMLTVVTPTLSLGGIAGNFNAGVSRTVIGHGVVVGEQNQLRQWNDYQFPGQAKLSPLTGSAENAATIGMGVARVLQLCDQLEIKNCAKVKEIEHEPLAASTPADISALAELEAAPKQPSSGAQIELLAANTHGAPNVAALQVVKAEQLGVKELDDLAITLHLKQAQQLIYGGDTPQVTAIVLQLKHTQQIAAAQARLNELMNTELKGMALEVHDFSTLNPSYGQITGMFAAIFSFITVLIGAIVLFTVGNTMSMAVVERTVEIGTLRAIGLRRSGIRNLFVCEGLLLGSVGAGLGVVLALIAAYLINHSGLSWMPPGNSEPVALMVRVWGEGRMIIGTVLGLLLVATLSAWWPARRAAQLNIVDALRHV
ncbi:ABC transporter permease [Chitinibacter fontanus]|uniref:ABC transporter permease n=1 Tax=Chitinibacter fontanus TaxID=1737446 RepID=A0A7D5V881_9NEIS|nr:FtsX-like permease family protein [Chitinibacter fontanus]QLI80535.1 ABC transporter permease [Chitinibacter fontanus]